MSPTEPSTHSPWRILVVDDDERSATNNADALNRASGSEAVPYPVEAAATKSFTEALDRVGRGDVDLLVLDVFDQAGAGTDMTDPEPVGRGVFDRVRAQRFVPIIFLTALPDQVDRDHNPPFVQILSKGAPDPFKALFAAVKGCLDSPFPGLYRDVRSHIENTSRRFMVDFVELRWDALEDRPADVAHLLMRRLGVSFDPGQNALTGYSTKAAPPAESAVPPIRYYVVPAPDEHRTGDIVTKTTAADGDGDEAVAADGGEAVVTRWYVVMTPSCDLVEGRAKAEYVVLAECISLSPFEEHKDWLTAETASNTKRKRLERLLKSNPDDGSRDRYFYLPAAWTVPDLMVDLQRITSIPYADLVQYDKQASLDDPYAAKLSHQFHCYLGRVGTPDLDWKTVIDGMRPQQ